VKQPYEPRSNRRMIPEHLCWPACALIALFGLVVFGIGPSIQAQNVPVKQDAAAKPDTPATVAVDVKVVTLPVIVRDKHGKIVHDLTKDDFTLQEDNRPQTIKYFAQETNFPLTLGLLVDTSRSQATVLDAERNASRSFLDQMMSQPKDKGFLIHFDKEVELLQDLTPDRPKLQASLDLLTSPGDRDRSNDPNDPSNSPSASDSPRSGKQLYDAVFLASNELLKKRQGRKVVILLSDGVDRGSKTFLDGAIEAAQRADTVVYSIYFAEPRHEDNQRQAGGPGRLAVDTPAAAVAEAVAEVRDLTRPRMARVRKIFSGFRRKPVGVSSKCLRKKRSAISMTAS
jgi:VWFA-related protein